MFRSCSKKKRIPPVIKLLCVGIKSSGISTLCQVEQHHLSFSHGIIFVIDAQSDMEDIYETSLLLHKLFSNNSETKRPVLILANKIDLEESCDEIDMTVILNLDETVEELEFPVKFDMCSAYIASLENHPDNKFYSQIISENFNWLMKVIENNWYDLDENVRSSTKVLEEMQEQERKEHLMKLREKRRLKEEQLENEEKFKYVE
ncbi:hypothetical protein SNEBB_006181 [Seison nebaliae]|nr:hypothetical protein SNEBB_006181 [Seison nebaliae]